MTSPNTVGRNGLRLLLEKYEGLHIHQVIFLETGTHIPDRFPNCYIAKNDLEFLTLLPNSQVPRWHVCPSTSDLHSDRN